MDFGGEAETPRGWHVRKRTTLAGELPAPVAAMTKSQAVRIWRRTAWPDLIVNSEGLSASLTMRCAPAGTGGPAFLDQ
jgi:hypothetical protein